MRFESAISNDPDEIVIRDIEDISEVRAVEALQKEVWGFSDLDIVPLSQLVAAKAAGGILIGAFDREKVVGFAYSFVGLERSQLTQHSHMVAVLPAYRNRNLGYRLKLAQRERALAQGITRMTWTFDPLQSLNAYFNFSKLGVLSDQYKINFYGEDSTSFLHRMGTDRLWVTWLLKSRRVSQRLKNASRVPEIEKIRPLVRVETHDIPRRGDLSEGLSQKRIFIEIPADINNLQQRDSQLAAEWRVVTRWAFTEALAAGYLVEEFYRQSRSDERFGVYLLSRGKSIDDFARE